MKHALAFLLVGITLLIVTAILVWPDVSLFFASDSCMASGGSFDFSHLRCDFRQSHAYVTFDTWPFWAAFACGSLGLALTGHGLGASLRVVARLRQPAA